MNAKKKPTKNYINSNRLIYNTKLIFIVVKIIYITMYTYTHKNI